MGLVNDIIEHDNLTEREQSIRTYLIKQPENLYNMSARDLGEATYSSAAAITRFCKKLGCKGYQDFRIRFLEDVREMRTAVVHSEQEYRLKTDDSQTSLMLKKADAFHRSIDRTLKENSFESVKKASEMIHRAAYLDFYAIDLGAVMANYAVYQFIQCGKAANVFLDHTMQIRNAMGMRPGHLAIIISYTGANARLIDLAKILRKSGTEILCFTGNTEGQLAQLADLVLILPTGENGSEFLKEEREILFTTSFKYLADILFAAEYGAEREKLAKQDEEYLKIGSDYAWQLDVGYRI